MKRTIAELKEYINQLKTSGATEQEIQLAENLLKYRKTIRWNSVPRVGFESESFELQY